MLNRIARIVVRPDTPTGRVFDIAITTLIIYSIVTLTIETLPDLPETAQQFLSWSEVVVTVIFTAEYLLRFYVASPKRSYVLSFNGLVDAAAIAPFYISLVLAGVNVDLRSLRIVRLTRIFRLLKIPKFQRAIARFARAINLIRSELILYLIMTVAVLYLAAVGIYYFENSAQPDVFKSIPHSMWWAVTTLTTVGYGDSFPVTVGGKFFTFVVLMIGLGIVAVPAGLLASSLAEVRQEEAEQRERRKK